MGSSHQPLGAGGVTQNIKGKTWDDLIEEGWPGNHPRWF